ncbi:uncharacterized protein [Montipora capricornis]|uniref:uncharacterized protein n=1 Tax=Montipora capricornis TaxID=246305 RepID=UPI0035F18BD8
MSAFLEGGEGENSRFGSTEQNRVIIDTVLELLRDVKHEYEKEELWFYDEFLGETEKDFYTTFDAATDNRELNEKINKRVELLDKTLKLCIGLDMHENRSKHTSRLKLKFKFINTGEKPATLGSKASGKDDTDDDISDDIDTAIAVAGDEDDDDEDDDENDDEVGGEEGKEEVGGEGNKQKGDKDVLDEGKELGGNEDEVAVEAEEIDTVELEHYEQEDNIGDNNVGDIGEGVIQAVVEDFIQEHHELQLEQQEESVDKGPTKTRIYEGTVTSEGIHLDLKVGAAHLTFPPKAVSEPTPITVHRWKCNALSPPLGEHEAVVSNVIEISTNKDAGAFEFNNEVKLALSHSAPDLKGYELVIKRLIDAETNEWEEVDGSEDFRCLSDIVDDYPSPNDIPDFSFPVVQADITECSTYAVVCRLKLSPEYTITVNGGTFSHPDYPDVTISVPKKSVPNKTKLPLQLKVQEVLQDKFDGLDLCSGPILRILGSPSAGFLRPVSIQLPISHGRDPEYIPDPTVCRVRIFFLRSDEESKEWIEITSDLENPASFDGNFVKFQVRRFSGYTCVVDWWKEDRRSSASGIITYLSSLIWNQPREANFFAYFKPTERLNSQDILFLICCPAHLREMVKGEHDKEGITSCDVSSRRKMIPGQDKAFVFVSGGMCPIEDQDMDDFYLRFYGDTQFRAQLDVRLISDQVYCKVKFRSTRETTGNNLLSTLLLKLPTLVVDHQNTPVEFFGVPLDDEILLQAPAEFVQCVKER